MTEFNKPVAGTQDDLIRIVSTASSNGVTFTPVSGSGVVTKEYSSGHECDNTSNFTFGAAGDWCDVLVEVGTKIESDFPIVVGQFMKGQYATSAGDPSLSIVLPTNQFRCGGPFFSFPDYDYNSTTTDGSYVNIVAPTAEIDDIELDAYTLVSTTTCGGYNPIDFGNGYSWTKCLLADPAAGGTQHIIDSDGTPIGVYVYGQIQAGSYAYVAGMGF